MSDLVAYEAEVLSAKAAWNAGVAAHYAYWFAVIHRHAGFEQAHEEFARDMRPDRPLLDYLRVRLPEGRGAVRVLDVGSGPVASCGWTTEGRELEVTAIDPLALIYGEAMGMAGLEPPQRTIQIDMESMGQLFETAAFDLVHLREALSQSFDPLRVLSEAVKLTRKGGSVIATGRIDDGEFCKYYALHQWNLRLEDGLLVLWRGSVRIAVQEALSGLARVTAFEDQGNYVATITPA